MKKYKIIRIDEDDYGCEARPDDYVPMVYVQLRALETNEWEEYEEQTVQMEDALMYTRNLDEGDEAVIGFDGSLYPPDMLCQELPEELDGKEIAQREWLDGYLEAVEELEE